MDVLERLRGGLVVSCQAYPGDPMNDPRTIAQLAAAVVDGGAVAVRAQGIDNLVQVRKAVDVPVVGLVKVGDDGVRITPTLGDALAVAATGCEVVAIDGTRRPRPDAHDLAQTIAALRTAHPGVLVMADCGSLADALAAQDAGADLVGTTLAGYTGERKHTVGPDLDLVEALASTLQVPVVAEGRISTPAQAAAALTAGAYCVCVGTAITHPATITSRFRAALPDRGPAGGQRVL